MKVISVGPVKWRIDEHSNNFRQHKSIAIQQRTRPIEREAKKEYKIYVLFIDARSPEGTEVQNECHKRNDIQFILPIVCFLFLYFVLQHSILRTFKWWDESEPIESTGIMSRSHSGILLKSTVCVRLYTNKSLDKYKKKWNSSSSWVNCRFLFENKDTVSIHWINLK